VGKVLGRGGFGVVNELLHITTNGRGSVTPKGNQQYEARRDMVAHCANSQQSGKSNKSNGGGSSFAIKRLHEQTRKDPTTFFCGVVDLALEARFLSVLRHPHIISLRGAAATDPYDGNFFLVLDRLHAILTLKLKTWKKQQPSKLMDRNGRKKKSMYVDRCQVAYDIASALKYMHSLHIIYRDVKPDNVGFTATDEVKIFDFDLIREVDPNTSRDGTYYKLTGQTGSTIYMAPEVALGHPYNESIDVYSFSILVWQILHLENPFDKFTQSMFEVSVYKNGLRPKCDTTVVTTPLANLLKRGWHANWKLRPTMGEMAKGLREESRRMGGKVVDVPSCPPVDGVNGSCSSLGSSIATLP